MIKLPYDKPIRFKFEKWVEIKTVADELSAKRGSKYSLPSVCTEAIKFFRENHPDFSDMAGTPDGKSPASFEDIQARRKEVIS